MQSSFQNDPNGAKERLYQIILEFFSSQPECAKDFMEMLELVSTMSDKQLTHFMAYAVPLLRKTETSSSST